MGDNLDYLEGLAAFSRVLSREGLAITPRDTGDAARVLSVLDLTDREQVKIALRTVYAKSREEQRIFDRVFDGFFLPVQTIRDHIVRDFEREEQLRRMAQEQLQINGVAMDFSPEQKRAYGAMEEENRSRLQSILEKYQQASARNPELYREFIQSIFTRAIQEQQMRMEDEAAAGRELDPEVGMLFREISQFRDEEIPQAIGLIQSITRTINGELSARRAVHGRSGALDFRRTIRKGLETGGNLYRLKYRKKRSRRKNLVLLCDVSGSMIRFSEFALRFIQNLNQVSDHSRVFLFSEELREADRFSLQDMDRFRSYVKTTGLYGKGTDLGQALEGINSRRPGVLSPATTLLILSDTKTVGQRRALRALKESQRLAGQVIILNPIPQRRWKYMASAQAFAGAANMISCATLQELSAACRRITLG